MARVSEERKKKEVINKAMYTLLVGGPVFRPEGETKGGSIKSSVKGKNQGPALKRAALPKDASNTKRIE